MSNILEKGDIIKKIRDGVDLDEIMSYARNSLYKDGPTDTIVLEILSYIKMFHPDYFKDYENDIVATMGLYFKNPVPESLEGLIFDLYNQHIQEKWGATYTPVQANILQQIQIKKCFSFSAPTSTGKSFVFRHIITSSTKDIAVVVPSRALINEYYDRVSELVNTKEVNVLSFVDQINTKHAKRNVFILTPERARELFKNKQWIDLEYILLDEAQLSDEDSTRGLYFDSIVRRALIAFPNAKFVFAHPFISNPGAQLKKNLIDFDENAGAMQYQQKNVGQIFYVHDGADYFHLGTNKEILGKTKLKANFDPIERILNDGGSVLIYVPKSHILNKSVYRKFAKYISMCPKIQDHDALKMIEDLRKYLGASKGNSNFYSSDMISKLEHGVVTHHGSMPLSARLILEHFTQKGFCRICLATSTLEQGINMPFDAVYIDRFEGSRSLSVKNLIGRAGRSTPQNKFDIGSVVIHDSAKTAFRKVIVKEEPISEVSHLDKKDENIDEKYEEFKKAIKEGTFNDEYNLTEADLEKLKTDQITTCIPELLDMMFDDQNKLIDGSEHQISSHFFISICSPRGDLLCRGFLINQLVVNVYFPRCLAVLTGALVDGDEFDQLQAHLAGQLRNLQVGFQTADEFIGVCRIITDGLRLLLQRGDCFSERFLFSLVFFQQVDTDFFGNLAQHLVLVNRADQLIKFGEPARGLRQLPFVGVGFGSVLLLVTAEEFLSRTLFIGKYKAHLGANVRKNKLV